MKERMLKALERYEPKTESRDFTGPCRIGRIRVERHAKRSRRGL